MKKEHKPNTSGEDNNAPHAKEHKKAKIRITNRGYKKR